MQKEESEGKVIKRIIDKETNKCWYHINYTSKESQDWVSRFNDISLTTRSILLAEETRPRTIVELDEVVMCLRGINFNEKAAPEDMVSIRIWLNQNTIITSSNRDSKSLAKVRAIIDATAKNYSTAELLSKIIEQLVSSTDDFIDSMEDALDMEEDHIRHSSFEEFNPKMSSLRRRVAVIRRFLAPQKEALDKLYRNKVTFLEESFYDSLYGQIDKYMHLIENLDLMKERIAVLQEQFLGFITHQQNSRLYLLAIISVIFLPLTFLSGLLGMNVAGLPGTESPTAFWIVTGFCVAVAVILLLWFKKKKWF